MRGGDRFMTHDHPRWNAVEHPEVETPDGPWESASPAKPVCLEWFPH